jgi:aryl-alcohol dehydrogenase-like predicted oxidoreductase
MHKRIPGNSSLEVSALGLGCLRMTFADKPVGSKAEMIACLHAVVERGVTFFLPTKNWWEKRWLPFEGRW